MPSSTRTSPSRTPRARAAVWTALPLALAVLTACDFPDVSMSPPSREATSSPAADEPAPAEATAAEVAAPVTPTRTSGELDVGSTTHVQPAGDRDLVIDWWTAEEPTAWTAADSKTVQLSAHLEGGEDEEELLVLITRFAAVQDDGTARTGVGEDTGEFAIQAPYTYGTVLTLPPVDAAATTVTVSVQFDLLIETEAGSERYFRQTVLDSLELPLATQETP